MCYRIAGNFDRIHWFWIQRWCRWCITSIWRRGRRTSSLHRQSSSPNLMTSRISGPLVRSCHHDSPMERVLGIPYRTWLSEDGDVNQLSIDSSCCFLPSKSGWSLPEWKVVSYSWLEPLVGWYYFSQRRWQHHPARHKRLSSIVGSK